jgi:subtilase family protein
MIALAAACLLLAAPARGSDFTVVEARPGATPYLRLTGARALSPSIGLWRVRSADVRRLARAGLVRGAEPERRLVSDATAGDPLLDNEWWLASVGATQVSAPGPGVPVAIVDTGLDFTHPEFVQRPDTASLNTQDDNDTIGDFHGTAVASVVGAPANDLGMVGIYPRASLYSYDADLSGELTNADLIEGIATAAAHGRIVINLSLGSTHFDALLDDEILAAYRSGALIVAAAGNSGASGIANYPASLPHVLTVAATTQAGVPAPFSSVSDGVDLAAPGVGISVAVPFLYTTDGYQYLNGTSFSAPIVSGAAALVWTVRSELDNSQLFDVLRFSAHDVAPAGFDPDTGFGLLDVPSALVLAAPNRDSPEPNDDVRLVKPKALFRTGEPPLLGPAKTSAFVRGSVDGAEDPDDVYRVWVPRRHQLVARASNSSVRLRLWRPATRTIEEIGASARRDLAASGTGHVRTTNSTQSGAYFYVDVRYPRAVGNARYQLNVRTPVAPATR